MIPRALFQNGPSETLVPWKTANSFAGETSKLEKQVRIHIVGSEPPADAPGHVKVKAPADTDEPLRVGTGEGSAAKPPVVRINTPTEPEKRYLPTREFPPNRTHKKRDFFPSDECKTGDRRQRYMWSI